MKCSYNNSVHIVRGCSLLGLSLLSLCLVGCAKGSQGGFQQLGSSILSQTGLVSGSQADTILSAGSTVAASIEGMSSEEEYFLGRGVSATILGKYHAYHDSAVDQYLNALTVYLASVSDRPTTYAGYRAAIIETPEINAVSAPSGCIFISQGFLKILDTEDQLAAVLAHEVAHVVLGHARSAISQKNLSSAFLNVSKEAASSQGGFITSELVSTFGDSVSEVSETLLVDGFSRSQEYAADEMADQILSRAGYNPGALKEVLEKLQAAASMNASGGWFSTHPSAQKRISELADHPAEDTSWSLGYDTRTKRFLEQKKRATR